MRLIIVYFITLCALFPNKLNAKNIAEIIVIGSGKTFEEAKKNGLRSALEQVTGVYLSSYSQIVNNVLIKDDIQAITNGSIIKYSIINKELINDLFILTINATVSPTELLNTVRNITKTNVEINGDIYVSNVYQKELDKQAEQFALDNLMEIYRKEIRNCYNYSIKASEPKTKNSGDHKEVSIIVEVRLKPNKNYDELDQLIGTNLKKIGLKKFQIEDYQKTTGNQVYILHEDYEQSLLQYHPTSYNGQVEPNLLYLRNVVEFPKSELFKFKINDGNCNWELIVNNASEPVVGSDVYHGSWTINYTWSSDQKLLKTDRFYNYGGKENKVILDVKGYVDEETDHWLKSSHWMNNKQSIIVNLTFEYVLDDFKNVKHFTIVE
jgi:hypothetical protein